MACWSPVTDAKRVARHLSWTPRSRDCTSCVLQAVHRDILHPAPNTQHKGRPRGLSTLCASLSETRSVLRTPYPQSSPEPVMAALSGRGSRTEIREESPGLLLFPRNVPARVPCSQDHHCPHCPWYPVCPHTSPRQLLLSCWGHRVFPEATPFQTMVPVHSTRVFPQAALDPQP